MTARKKEAIAYDAIAFFVCYMKKAGTCLLLNFLRLIFLIIFRIDEIFDLGIAVGGGNDLAGVQAKVVVSVRIPHQISKSNNDSCLA